jgi:hypothetical protein
MGDLGGNPVVGLLRGVSNRGVVDGKQMRREQELKHHDWEPRHIPRRAEAVVESGL